MPKTDWTAFSGTERWSPNKTKYTHFEDANRASIEAGKGGIKGEWRLNRRGKIRLRTGARAVRLRDTGRRFKRMYERRLGDATISAKIKRIDADHRFDKAVNELVEDLANGSIKSPRKFGKRFEALYNKGEALLTPGGEKVTHDGIVARFRARLADSLELLRDADKARFDRAMDVLSAFKNVEDRDRGVKTGPVAQFADELGTALIGQVKEVQARIKHPSRIGRRESFALTPRPARVPGCVDAKALRRDQGAVLLLQKDVGDPRASQIDSKPIIDKGRLGRRSALPALDAGDLRGYRLDSALANAEHNYANGQKPDNVVRRAATPLQKLDMEAAAAAGAVADVQAQTEDLAGVMANSRCAFLPEIHGATHNNAIGVAALDAAYHAKKPPVLMFETAFLGDGAADVSHEHCEALGEQVARLHGENKTAAHKAMELLWLESGVNTYPDEDRWQRDPVVKATEAHVMSGFAAEGKDGEIRQLDEVSERQLNRNQVMLERFLLLKRAFETKTPIVYVPSARPTDANGTIQAAMPDMLKAQMENDLYPLAFFGSGHALSNQPTPPVSPASMNLGEKFDGVSLMTEATLRTDAHLEGAPKEGRNTFVGQCCGVVALPGLGQNREVRAARSSPLLAVRTEAHHMAKTNAAAPPASPPNALV